MVIAEGVRKELGPCLLSRALICRFATCRFATAAAHSQGARGFHHRELLSSCGAGILPGGAGAQPLPGSHSPVINLRVLE